MNKPSFVRWRVLGILIFASFISYVLRGNISLAAPAMMEDLGLTLIQWGWVTSAFAAGYAIFGIPGGVISDRFGPRKVLTWLAVIWGFLTIVTAFIPGKDSASTWVILGSLISIRFLVGMFHAPVFPTVAACVQRWFPTGAWGFPNGLTSTGLTLGFAAAAPVLAWLVIAYGWRMGFVMLSPLAFVVAALWWWYARDYPNQHAGVNEQELVLIEDKREIDRHDLNEKGSWLKVLKNRDIQLLFLSYFCMGFVFWDVFNYFFTYLVDYRGMPEIEAGFVVSSQWIAGAIGAAAGGLICDWLCQRYGLRIGCRWPVIIGMLVSGVLLIGGAFSPSPAIAMWLFIFCFLFNQLTEGGYWSSAIAIGGRHAGAAGGVLNTGNNVMGVINAIVVPILVMKMGWDFAIAIGGVFAFAGAGFMYLVRPDRPM